MIEWGGEIVNSQSDGHHTSTQMGSGRSQKKKSFSKASYLRNIEMVDSSNNLAPKRFGTFTELFNCYNVQPGNNDD